MLIAVEKRESHATQRPLGAPPCSDRADALTIAVGSGWRMLDLTCNAGPRSRPFEEQHECVSVSLVMSGAFTYRSTRGRALLAPGMFLLGRCGDTFVCSHEHGSGDRCLSIQYSPGFFEQVAVGVAGGPSAPDFRRPALPPLRQFAPLIAGLQTLCDRPSRPRSALFVEELVVSAVPLALGALVDAPPTRRRASSADERRIADVARAAEQHLSQDLSLTELATTVDMSPYHFLRVFRQVLGTTPHQWLLNRRLAAASRRLTQTSDAVTEVALDVGFGDISTFNAAFRRAFGATPTEHRRRLGDLTR